MTDEDKKVDEAINLILRGNDIDEVQKGADKLSEILFENDKLNIIKRYLYFLENIQHIKNKNIAQSDPTLELDIYAMSELNNLLKNISK